MSRAWGVLQTGGSRRAGAGSGAGGWWSDAGEEVWEAGVGEAAGEGWQAGECSHS